MEFNYKKVSDLRLFARFGAACVLAAISTPLSVQAGVWLTTFISMHCQVADYLAEKGAKTNIRNKKGRTAYEMEGMEDPDADDSNETSPNHQIRGGGRS